MKSFNNQSPFILGIKSFWTILNNQCDIGAIRSLNDCNKATITTCFEFTTFYTSMPVGMGNLLLLISMILSGVTDKGTGATHFTKTFLKKAVKILLDSCYFKVG